MRLPPRRLLRGGVTVPPSARSHMDTTPGVCEAMPADGADLGETPAKVSAGVRWTTLQGKRRGYLGTRGRGLLQRCVAEVLVDRFPADSVIAG